jgi:hypothetical protein
METNRSPIMVSSGRSPGTGRPPASPDTGSPATELFTREVSRAVERQGGDQAVEQRQDGTRDARRTARHAGFERYAAERGATRRAERDIDGVDSPTLPQALAHSADASDTLASGSIVDADSRDPSSSEGAAAARPAPPTPLASPAAGRAGVGAITAQPAPVGDTGAGPAQSAGAPRAGTGASRQASAVSATASPAAGRASASEVAARGLASEARLRPAVDVLAVERAAEVLRQIKLALSGGRRHVRLELEPAELGKLSIHLALRDGHVRAIVRADSPETLALLESRVSELATLLADEGVPADGFAFLPSFHGARHGRAGGTAGGEPRAPEKRHPNSPTSRVDGALPRAARIGELGVDTYA